jgi:hypothetical protein
MMKKQGNWYMWLVGDAHIDACMACSHYKDALKPTPNKKRSKVSLRKKLFKYYKRAKHGGTW